MNSIKNQTINLYVTTERIIFWVRHQNYYRANGLIAIWTEDFKSYIKLLLSSEGSIFSTNSNYIITTLQSILNAQENDDYLLIADILENEVFEIYKHVIGKISDNLNQSKNAPDQTIEIFDTPYGLKNIQFTNDLCSTLLHSSNRPISQSLQLCSEYYSVNTNEYIIFGLGMGYHVIELSNMCNNCIPIKVYECNEHIIEVAQSQQYFMNNCTDNINIIHDPNLVHFSSAISNISDKTLIIHSPSLKTIENTFIRKKMNEMFIHDSSIRNQLCEMLSNYRKNVINCTHYVDELKTTFQNKNVFLIAAGPSLDNNIELLKNKPSDSIILAVGSVYKKLVNLHISPDFVVFLDCKDSLFSQVSGLENLDMNYIIASTACARIAEKCNGIKYLVCQEGLNEAEEYAESNSFNIYKSGGSVSTIAFDVAIKLGSKKIITLGLDLSIKDGKMHADDAGSQNIMQQGNEYISIPGYYEDTVLTTPNMEIYRQWFINYIKENKDSLPIIINATEGGCDIEGMQKVRLSEILNNP